MKKTIAFIKRNMKIGGLLILLVFTSSMGWADNPPIPVVDVQGNAQREVMPDELTLSITIKESDYKGKISLEEKQKALIKVLKKNEVDYTNDLSIKQLGSTATFKFFSKQPTPRSEATYYLKLHDAATMQAIVNDLEEEKITNIDLIQTRYTKADQLKLELGQEAIKKAQSEAKALASAIDQTIGKAISINSWMSNNAPRPRIYRLAMNAEAMNDGVQKSASIPTPNITGILYTVNVSVKFELK